MKKVQLRFKYSLEKEELIFHDDRKVLSANVIDLC